jgi:hypothetical protein
MTSPVLWMGGCQLLPLGYSIPVGPFEVKRGGLDILYSIPNLKLLSWPPYMEAQWPVPLGENQPSSRQVCNGRPYLRGA